ncbi:hypothetical protein LJY25_18580 [Hymenobacter sp. BT175]|uniref:hypothetical protein n=1 Tax=Hymenobacter translucens TaxID=2886507 RepID=UPI001D0E8024|nr:hypothetical protein [Hymenobacter translucens]MCC2548460.1 hypothetical protein [Hymenobacter translucens]
MTNSYTPYPNYRKPRSEENEWFSTTIFLGKTKEGLAIVALGLHKTLEPRTVEALVIDRQDAPGEKPMLLGRLLKFDPYFDLVFDQKALQYLRQEHGMWVGKPRPARRWRTD